jgi:hypothetical protein
MRSDVAVDGALQELFDELTDARVSLSQAYVRFNNTVEPELIDACVFEINALQSRYNYLLRTIKERGGAAVCKTVSEGAATWI